MKEERSAPIGAVLFGLFTLAFVALHFYEIWYSQIRFFPDTDLYFNLAGADWADMARRGIVFSELFQGMRPFLFIWFLKVLGTNGFAVAIAQTSLYIVCAAYLAFSVWKACNPLAMQVGGTLLIYLLALYPDFAMWNVVILSESVSISLTYLSFAFLIRWLQSGRMLYFGWLTAVLLLNTHVRDFNVFYSLLFLGIFLLVLIARRRPDAWVVFAGALILGNVVLASNFAEHAGPKVSDTRWFFPMLNNIGQRVLTNKEFTEVFMRNGMPMNPALASMSGRWAHEEDGRFYNSSDLEEFRAWVRTKSRASYAELLILNPWYAVASLWSRKDDVFHQSHFATLYYIPKGFRFIETLRLQFGYLYALNFVLVCWLAARFRRTPKAAGALNSLLLGASISLLALPTAFFTFHVDAMEVARHSLPVPLHAFMSTAVCICLLSPRLMLVENSSREA